ncbi:MAG: hypothetical protein K2X55_10165 [Burkholderiaceae bacterium]|nr:hypothetical protein [Burkholderiaceae bacterium]
MNAPERTNSKQVCEDILNEEKRYNIERGILASENAVADRLLARHIELTDAYDELHSKLIPYPGALHVFIGLILSTAAFWNPEKIRQARAARNELEKVNGQIARTAAELAAMLRQRSDLHDTSGFSSDTHYHVCDVIGAAARDNHLFTVRVQERLDALSTQFDLKYWPTLGDFVQELASDADASELRASDPLTAAATNGTRHSLTDFFKALLAAIETNTVRNCGHLPNNFKVTDGALASIVNCALDLDANDIVDSQYVKQLRQRLRNRARQR